MKKMILKEMVKKNTLIGIRTNNLDWDETIVGFINSIEETCFTINEIDKYGLLIGSTIIKIEDVINIDINDRYLKRLKYIYDNKSIFNYNDRTTIWGTGDELIKYFKLLFEKKSITTFFYDEEDYLTGILMKYDKKYIKIMCVGDEGDEDGISYYPIDKLIGLRYDGIEEQRIKLLYQNRDKFYDSNVSDQELLK